MATDIFAPHGANPLAPLRILNPRTARVDFDRATRSNVLIMEGDVTQSKAHMPKEDRPLHSLQLTFPIIGFQIMCPSSGQFGIELTLSQSIVSRLRLTAATFVSKAEVNDSKGMPHIKLPLALPRNVWTQAVLNIPGVVVHLFKLPSVKWIDAISFFGSVKLRRIFGCHDEKIALDKPSGMLLFTLPAYGPPLWTGAANRSAAEEVQKPVLEVRPFAMRFVRESDGSIRFTAAVADDEARRRAHSAEGGAHDEEVQDCVDTSHDPLSSDDRPLHLRTAVSAPPPVATRSGEDIQEVPYRRLIQPPLAPSSQPHHSRTPTAAPGGTDTAAAAVRSSLVLSGWDEPPAAEQHTAVLQLRGGRGKSGGVVQTLPSSSGRGAKSRPSHVVNRSSTVSQQPQSTSPPPPVASEGFEILSRRAESDMTDNFTFRRRQDRLVGYGVGDLDVMHSTTPSSDADSAADDARSTGSRSSSLSDR